MKTLWTFGDSFTFGHGCRLDGPLSEYCRDYKTESDDIWPNLLGKILNCDVKNFGKCGASNDFIIDCIIDQWDGIKKDDIVIIEISYHSRFDVPLTLQNKPSLTTNYWEFEDLKNFEGEEREKMETMVNFQYHFANSELYKKRYLKRINFLHKLLRQKKITTFVWDVVNFTGPDKFEKIIDHTEGKIEDYHFSFKGHKDFTEMVYERIKTPNLL